MAVVRSHAGNRVGFTNVPAEGPLSVGFYLNFAANSSYYFNIVDFTSKGEGYAGLTSIQSLWVDNSENNSEASIYISQTNQTIIVPALSQGYYPILCPDKGTITISAPTSSVIQLSFLNFLMDQAQWFPSGVNTNIVGVVNVSVEGLTFTGGYLNTLDATLASIKGSETSANALPVYQVNNPTSIQVSNTVAVSGNVGINGTVPVSGSVSVNGTVPVSGSVSISGNPVNNVFFLNTANPITTSTLIIPATGTGLVINSVMFFFGMVAYLTTVTAQSVTLYDSLGNELCNGQIELPTTEPTATATNSIVLQTFLNLTNLNVYIIGGLYLKWTGATPTVGALNVMVTYRQSNGN